VRDEGSHRKLKDSREAAKKGEDTNRSLPEEIKKAGPRSVSMRRGSLEGENEAEDERFATRRWDLQEG